MKSPLYKESNIRDNFAVFPDYSPGSWKINPNILSEQAHELWLQENRAPIIISEDVSLRPKILDACGMTCTFCHNEGTPVTSEAINQGRPGYRSLGRVSIFSENNGVNFLPGRMRPDENLYEALSSLSKAVGIEEVHLTGGEPTLHSEIPEIIGLARSMGLRVRMTSNGENPKVLEKCAEAGLERVSFSIFGTTALELSQVQHPRFQNQKFAQRKIDSLRNSIKLSGELGIDTSANIVVPGPGHEERVISIVNEFEHLSLKLLNSLDEGDASFASIYELLARLEATPSKVKLTAGSSNTRIDYSLPNNTEISFKQIRPARFNHICEGCEIDKAGKCEEGFYGLRLYINQEGEYLVGMCIQRMDLAMHLDEFLNSGLPAKITGFRQAEKKSMISQFGNLATQDIGINREE
ncbi:radical SAM protein [Candidatus Saccharibacteria bacterium]|nr:radical SAM protein [Candidatus Saccharibacteria bacterium]